MAKKRKQTPKKSKQRGVTQQPQQSNAAKAQSRRAMLQYGGLGAVLLLGGGYFGTRALQASIAETDLTRVGQGTPAVVQIHDPGCPICNKLQKEARKALDAMDGDQPAYLVANIKTLEGSTFAANYGVPHVTLLTFDGEGQLVDTLRGAREAAELTTAFESLMRRDARS